MVSPAVWLGAVLVDAAVGDPRVNWHPVALIGRAIAGLESALRPKVSTPRGERWAGILLVAVVVSGSFSLAVLVLHGASVLHPWLGVATGALLLSATIAAKSLAQAADAIYRLLVAGDMAAARARVGEIVGRDTRQLDSGEIVRATVETVAENIVDGIISPLFYALLGGVPLAVAYRAVNTLDSMLGYKNERYVHFGWAAARLDDVANYVPARITGLLLLAVTVLFRLDARGAWQAVTFDAPRHPSPNSGIPEAAVAGALGVRLGGQNYYQGIPSFRAYMGQPRYPLLPLHIKDAVRMMYGATVIFVVLGLVIMYIF